MKRIIVFDLDGTLAETAVYWLPVLEKTTRTIFDLFGLMPVLSPAETLKLLGKPDLEIYGILYPGQKPERYAELMNTGNKIWAGMLENHPYQLFSGAHETLSSLKKLGFAIFVASNCDIAYLEGVTRQMGIFSYLDDARCAEHHPGMEKWEFTREMLGKLPAYSGYFVGDSSLDMIAGRQNGLATVYASYGYAPRPEPSLIDHEIRSLSELPALLS